MVIAGSMMGLNESSINDMTADIKPTDYSMCGSVMEACYQMMSEVATNENNFIKAIALKEMTYFQENGVEIVYEEGGIKGILDKAVAIVKSWFSKVMGVLQNVTTRIAAQLANITKSIGPNIKKLDGSMTFPADKEFEDYNYKAALDKIAKVPFIGSAGNPFNEKDGMKEIQGGVNRMLGFSVAGKTPTVADFKKKYVGEKVKINGSVYTAEICKSAVTGFKDGIANINKLRGEAKKTTNDMIKTINAKSKEMKKGDGVDKEAKKAIGEQTGGIIKTVNTINAINSALLTANLSIMIGHLNMAKRCAGIYLSAAKKDKKAGEKTPETKSESAFSLDFDLV